MRSGIPLRGDADHPSAGLPRARVGVPFSAMSIPEHLRAGPGRDRAIDVALALASLLLAVTLMASGGFGNEESDARGLDALGGALAALASLPLVFRRAAIVPVFVA